MRRGLKLFGLALAVLVALVVVNKFVTDSETKPAAADAPGGELVETSAGELQVVDSGTSADPGRSPLVLLHCFGCSGRWWDPLTEALDSGRRVVIVDLLGHGGSEKPAGGYDIETQAAAVSEALAELGVQNATVVGHSMGGMVAAAMAETSSDLVDRVVVIGTPSTSESSELPFTARLATTPFVGEAAWRVRTDSLIRSGYEESFAPGFDFDAAFGDADRVVEDNRAMTYTSFSESQRESGDFMDARPVASRLTAVPLLAIFGSEDAILDPELAAEQYGAVPGARVEVLEGVGHSPNVEAPDEVAALVEEFAAAGDAPASGAGSRAGGGPRGGGQR